jgi:MFS family permease
MFLMPAASSLHWFFAVRVIEGLGVGALVVSTESAINLLTSNDSRGKALGVYSLMFAGGLAVGPIIGAFMPENSFVPFWTAGFVIAAGGVSILATFHNRTPRHSCAQTLSYDGVFACVWAPLSAVACYAIIEGAMLSLFPIYLASAGFPSSKISLLFAVYGSAAVIGPLAAGALSDYLSREWVMAACGGLLAASTAILWSAAAPPLMVAGLAVMGFATGALYPLGLSSIGDRIPPAQLGAANGFFTGSYSVGSVAGTFIAGWAMGMFGDGWFFAPLLAVSAVFTALMLVDVVRQPSLHNDCSTAAAE